jgi:hypothetical protein
LNQEKPPGSIQGAFLFSLLGNSGTTSKEKGAAMIRYPLTLDHAAPDAILWRYMDLPKLLAIIQSEALVFPCLRMFDDKWEGYAKPSPFEEFQKWNSHYKWSEEEARQKHDEHVFAVQVAPSACYASCWHLHYTESAFMWKTYLGSNEGIAIQTTQQRLVESFKETPKVILSAMVRYQHEPSMNIYWRAYHKRPSFIHEQEKRLVYVNEELLEEVRKTRTSIKPKVEFFEIDPKKLIERIYIAPSASGYFRDVVTKILEKYGHDFEIKQSDLNSDPDSVS